MEINQQLQFAFLTEHEQGAADITENPVALDRLSADIQTNIIDTLSEAVHMRRQIDHLKHEAPDFFHHAHDFCDRKLSMLLGMASRLVAHQTDSQFGISYRN